MNHHNRSKHQADSPTSLEIKELRVSLKLTQSEAAGIVYCTLRGWQMWEAGDRKMPYGLWELFRLKTGVLSLDSLLEKNKDSLKKSVDINEQCSYNDLTLKKQSKQRRFKND